MNNIQYKKFKFILSILYIFILMNGFKYHSLLVSIFIIYGYIFHHEMKQEHNRFINNIKKYFVFPLSPFEEYGHRDRHAPYEF